MYEHHCIRQLPPAARKLRDAAAYLVQHSMVVQWALELHGFQDVSIKVCALTCLCRAYGKYGVWCWSERLWSWWLSCFLEMHGLLFPLDVTCQPVHVHSTG